MSIASTLSIAKSALITHQRALDVTGHNIANAATPGYTRQRLEIVPHTPFRTPLGTIGRGVTDLGVFAHRDVFLDGAVRRETAVSSGAATLRDQLARLEGVFGEPSETGLGATLDRFFNAWSDLANDPASGASRTAVQQAGNQLAGQFSTIADRIDSVDRDAREQVRGAVAEINSITQRIAELNRKIPSAGGPNKTAPDLEDERARLLDRLATLTDVRVLERPDGTVGVIAAGTLLVDGPITQQLETRGLPGGGLGVAVVGNAQPLKPQGGVIAGLVEVTERALPQVRAELDQLAAAMVAEINALHQSGTTAGGATGVSFFDPAGTTARTMALSAEVAGSAGEIVTGTSGLPGDTALALQLAGMRTTGLAGLGGRSPADFYVRLVTDSGARIQDAGMEAAAAGILANNAEAQRSGITGVSIDEEMVALIKHQQAFAAAARLVSVADEMLSEILRMV